jgi:phage portal protein BeeE
MNDSHDGYLYNGEQGLIGRGVSRAFEAAARTGFGQRVLVRAAQTASKIPFFASRVSSWLARLGFAAYGGIPGMDSDYSRWAISLGDVRMSSIFQAGLRWGSLGLQSARLMLVKLDLQNQQTEVAQSDALDLLARPNPYCTWTQFMAAFTFNWLAKSAVYIRKVRDEASDDRRVIELWPEPYWKARPVVKQGPGGVWDSYISYYEVERNGKWYRVDVQDMIVFRDGFDPETREGNNWLAALAPELFTDRAVGKHCAKMVDNGFLPAVVLGLGDKKNPVSPQQVAALQNLFDSKSRKGDSNVWVTSGNVSKAVLNSDYSIDALVKLRQTPEQRFAAGMGVSVISLLFGAGVEVSTYSNVEQYMRRDYRSWVVPIHTIIAETLTLELLPEFQQVKQANGKRFQFAFDYSQVPEMQRDKQTDSEWVAALWNDDLLTQAEAREQMGYPGGEQKYKSEIVGSKAAEPSPIGMPGVPVPATEPETIQ